MNLSSDFVLQVLSKETLAIASLTSALAYKYGFLLPDGLLFLLTTDIPDIVPQEPSQRFILSHVRAQNPHKEILDDDLRDRAVITG